jgi:succinyl-CoA:(S)-malate CoA-transferase subunit B
MTAKPIRPPPIRPLQGIRVLDVSSYIAGPFCTTQLAEFGAEVIKLELPGTGDALRKFGTRSKGDDTLLFLGDQRNRKSVTLDLHKSEGAEIFKRLAAQAEVLVENCQVGTLERWGVGWEVLHAVNPASSWCASAATARRAGPYRDRPGFGRIANAFGGLSFLAGYPDRPPVTPGSATIPHYLAGIYGALGAMYALRARDLTGEGQFVDIGLYEPVFRILDELAAVSHQNGTVRQRMGAGTVNAVPHSHYPTKDGRWLAIACTTDKIFARLAALMGREDVIGGGK